MYIDKIEKLADSYKLSFVDGSSKEISEIIALSFDDAEGLIYSNRQLDVKIENITIARSISSDEERSIIDALNSSTNDVFYMTFDEAIAHSLEDFSIIYIGSTNAFKQYGSINGISETIGQNAAESIKDNAFVITNNLNDVESIIDVVQHETGHLVGTHLHDYGEDGLTIDDFFASHSYIRSTTTYSNKEYSGSSTGVYNGSVFTIVDCTLTLNSCTFHDNTCKGGYSGGAIGIRSDGKLRDTNGNYYNNVSKGNGGALWTDNGHFILNGTTFTNNSADKAGGAIYQYDDGEYTSVTFTSNKAKSGSGGAIYVRGTWITLKNCVLNSNSCTDDGGGMAIASDCKNITMTGGSATGNTAGRDGGFVNNDQTFTMTNVTVQQNSAPRAGGIYNNSSLTTTGSTFASNTASNGEGGAVCNTNTMVSENTDYTGNSSTSNGGAINNSNSCSVTGGTFSGNHAVTGGAINNTATLSLTDVKFSGNYATTGGAIYNNTSNFTIVRGELSGNYSTGSNGGAIYSTTALSFTNTDMKSNYVQNGYSGGAVYTESSLSVSGGTIDGNSAGSNGGAFINVNGLSVSNATLSNNKASNGAAIFNGDGKSTTLTNNAFSGNTATGNGGAVYNGTGSADLTGSSFSKNMASNGGAIYSNGTISLSPTNYAENTATSNGGAIYNTTSVTIPGTASSPTTFSGNTAASNGGAIYNAGTVVLNCVVFNGNSASNGGAILNASGATLRLYDDVTLGTSTDTIVNNGTMIWDLNENRTPYISDFNNVQGTSKFVIDIPSGYKNDAGIVIASNASSSSSRNFYLYSNTEKTIDVNGSGTDFGAIRYRLVLVPNSSDSSKYDLVLTTAKFITNTFDFYNAAA